MSFYEELSGLAVSYPQRCIHAGTRQRYVISARHGHGINNDTTAHFLFLRNNKMSGHYLWYLSIFVTEIDAADIFIGTDFIWCAFKQGFTLKEDRGAVYNIESFSDPVIGDQNTNAAFFQI